MRDSIRFGSGGNCERFYAEGNDSSIKAPAWLAAQGLDAYEYEAGHGIRLSENSARAIGEAAAEAGVAVSIHSPYFINCATEKPDHRARGIADIVACAKLVALMGGDRVVVHPGSSRGGRDRALERAGAYLLECRARICDAGLERVHICPETLGKVNTLGTPEDIAWLCGLDESFIPVIDYAHLHARYQGALTSQQAFFDYTRRVLGGIWPAFGVDSAGRLPYRIKHFHVHFSHVEYGKSGEIRHRRFSEAGYGPEFEPFARMLRENGLEPVVICESAGSQADDALEMRRAYEACCEQLRQ